MTDQGTTNTIIGEPARACPGGRPSAADAAPTPAGPVVLTAEDFARLVRTLSSPPDAILLSAADVARVLCLSLRTVRHMDRFGKIPEPIHVGERAVRWRRQELIAWCAAGCPKRSSWTWQPGDGAE